jgi:lipopolysaccharide transport system ATP-binding protein
MTGRENIYMNGAIMGMTRAEIARKFDEIVDFAGVERYIDTPVKRYSSGMTVRLGFAVAAFLEPEILVVDEVLAVGDAEFQKKAIGKMQNISHGDGRTVLFVSHNMDSISNLCKNCILLKDGMLQMYSNTENVIAEYLSNENIDAKYEYKGANKKLYIKSAYPSTSEFEPTNFFYFNQPIILVVNIINENKTINEHTILGISLMNKNKNRIFTIEKYIYNLFENSIFVTLMAEIPRNIIAPGTYSFLIAIHNPNVTLYDEVYDCCRFRILDTGTDYLKYNTGNEGCIYIEPHWKIL